MGAGVDEFVGTIVPARLGDGLDILVEVRSETGGEVDVADDPFSFDRVSQAIKAIAERVTAAIDVSRPTKASVEFGLDVGMESGGLTALLVRGKGNATLKITLEWDSSTRPRSSGV